MAEILPTPGACLFFADLLPRLPAERRPAAAMHLARALYRRGIATEEWRSSPEVHDLLWTLRPYTGVAWIPDEMVALLVTPRNTAEENALNRREKIAGRTPSELLSDAEDLSGAPREALLALVEDAVIASEITGTGSDDDSRVARAGVRLLRTAAMTWAAARPEIDAVETECRAVRQANPGHREAGIVLGRALWQRATTMNDRDAAPVLREALELLMADGNDASRVARPAAGASVRLADRSPKSEALALLARADGLLARYQGPPLRRVERARIELQIALANYDDARASLERIQAALATWQVVFAGQNDDPQALLLRARMLARRAEEEPRPESLQTLEEAAAALHATLSLDPANYYAHTQLAHLMRGQAQEQPRALEAKQLFQKAIEIDPDRPEGYAGLLFAADWRAENLPREARAAVLEEAWISAATALQRFDGFAVVHRWAGRIRAAQFRLQGGATLAVEAARHFELAAALLPSDAGALDNWGYLLLHQARQADRTEAEALLAGAVAKFQQVLEVRPGSKWALSGLADSLTVLDGVPADRERADLETALARYGEVLQADPTFRQAVLGAAGVRIRLSRLKPQAEALALLDQASADLDEFLSSNHDDAWAHQVRGHAYFAPAERADDGPASLLLDSALEDYRRAVELGRDEWSLFNDQGDVLRMQAFRFDKRELFDEAAAVYGRVPKDSGRDYVRALIGLGRTQYQRTIGAPRKTPEDRAEELRCLHESRRYLGDAVRLAPENNMALRSLAGTLRRIAEIDPEHAAPLLEEAEGWAREAVKTRPGHPASLTLLGEVLHAQAMTTGRNDTRWSQLADASRQYAAALEVVPDHFLALLGQGRTAMAMAEIGAAGELLPKAVEFFERALAARPSDQGVQRELEEARKRLADSPLPDATSSPASLR